MTPRTRIPISLYVVAALFFISGAFGLFRTIQEWRAGQLSIPFDALSLFIGVGLLRRRGGWRKCALWVIGITLAFVVLYFGWFSISGHHANFAARVPSWMPSADVTMVLYLIAIIAVEMWSWHVLTRKDVVAVYAPNAA